VLPLLLFFRFSLRKEVSFFSFILLLDRDNRFSLAAAIRSTLRTLAMKFREFLEFFHSSPLHKRFDYNAFPFPLARREICNFPPPSSAAGKRSLSFYPTMKDLQSEFPFFKLKRQAFKNSFAHCISGKSYEEAFHFLASPLYFATTAFSRGPPTFFPTLQKPNKRRCPGSSFFFSPFAPFMLIVSKHLY